MIQRDVEQKDAVCNTCTVKLVALAYRRAPTFRLLREPLRLAMIVLSWLYHVDPAEYAVRTPACYRCLRFRKTALKERSALFRWLNDRINPVFDRALERIITEEEVGQAKRYARAASAGEVEPTEASAWVDGTRPR
jgi:hypothetical protein